LAEITSIIQSGVRRVYYPPAVSADTIGYEWSWLRPTTTITTAVDDIDYDLPDDFGRLVGAFHYPADEHRNSISIISVGSLLAKRAQCDDSDAPVYAAVRYKASDGTGGQRQEVLFYPKPSEIWVLTYEYEAYNGALSVAAPYPLGGMQMAELYIESCLAVAESRMNDSEGVHANQFQELLLDAVSRDRKKGSKFFGQMGHKESFMDRRYRGETGGTYPITYHGVDI
jgi:hypothetical protein